jgi:hypothetical protein
MAYLPTAVGRRSGGAVCGSCADRNVAGMTRSRTRRYAAGSCRAAKSGAVSTGLGACRGAVGGNRRGVWVWGVQAVGMCLWGRVSVAVRVVAFSRTSAAEVSPQVSRMHVVRRGMWRHGGPSWPGRASSTPSASRVWCGCQIAGASWGDFFERKAG